MIAIDTSALLAVLLGEPEGPTCRNAILLETQLMISAVTLAEAFVVARSRGVLPRLSELLDQISIVAVPADQDTAARVSAIYLRWGKGNHPARLNFVDCFSYDIARQFDCPLLFIGNDFSQTDIANALA